MLVVGDVLAVRHVCLVQYVLLIQRCTWYLRIAYLLRVVICLPAVVSRSVLSMLPCLLRSEEIYVVSIGALAGRGFSELVQHMFEQHGVILLGISEEHRVVLHPGAGYIVSQVPHALQQEGLTLKEK